MKQEVKIFYSVFSSKIFLIAFALCFLLVNAVKAETVVPKIGVSPSTFELELERGKVFEGTIKIFNKSDVPIPMIVHATDFSAVNETGQMVFDDSLSDPVSSSKLWFKLENPNILLDPQGFENLKFSINVPDNAEPGGHYAVVLFEPQLPSYYFAPDQPKTIPIIGVLFLLSVKGEGPGTNEPLQVLEFSIPANLHLKFLEKSLASVFGVFSEAWAAGEKEVLIVESSNFPFSLRIKNNDIYHIKPEGKLEIFNLLGMKVGETEIQKTTILPGKIRQIPVEFKEKLPALLEKYLPASVSDFISRNFIVGRYQAVLSLETEVFDGQGSHLQNLSVSSYFWVFPWKIILIIFALTAALLIMRKRISAALKILFIKPAV